ncbi:hypothetical protein KP509_10G081600 [Ceratopteris richardii]|uniref:Uncharacterized protein n=1 Tax=Ceratopteris richardii TaxID=49495 RepID=A0A8T2TWW4_CERRI|nr:hypothetical protein KP509_10G081600 [Ceratopteris richardii]
MSKSILIRLGNRPICLTLLTLVFLLVFECSITINAAEGQDDTNGDSGEDSACLKGFVDAFFDSGQMSGRSTPFASWTSSALQGNPCMNSAGAKKLAGVTCNSRNRVESIDLPSEGLVGELPSSVSLCSFLANLDLSSNGITGDIPVSLGNLPNLVTLSLAHNQISGLIPLELSSCYMLKSLDLRNNNLSGPIPAQLGLLPLLEFNVSYNNLSGSIPFTLSNTSSGSPRFGGTSFLHNPGLHGYPLPDEGSESTKASTSQKKIDHAIFGITILFTVGVACCLFLLCALYAGYCRTCRERGIVRKDLEQNRLSASRSSVDDGVDGWKEVLSQLSRSS